MLKAVKYAKVICRIIFDPKPTIRIHSESKTNLKNTIGNF